MKTLLQFSLLLFATFCFGQTPIYHYMFNGNLNEANGGPAFALQGVMNGVTYPDNNRVFLNVNSTGQTAVLKATLPNLPQGSASRTISVRIMFASGALAVSNKIFAYGSNTSNRSLGYNQSSTGTLEFGGNTSASVAAGMNTGQWYNLAITFSPTNTTLKVYLNGVESYSDVKPLNTLGTTFILGHNITENYQYCYASIDDLRIYNTALSQAEITSLNATLSSENFSAKNLKFSMYPNPANSLLNIDMANEIQSVEIYSFQGQKVLNSKDKQINISNLSSGMYMVRVQDVNGGVATQKLVKE